jgi:hypothetical protein
LTISWTSKFVRWDCTQKGLFVVDVLAGEELHPTRENGKCDPEVEN